jgi:hypothetical protein
MTTAVHLDLTALVMRDLTALLPWFSPPPHSQVENLATAGALACACYALPGYARNAGGDGQPRWWPFSTGYTPVEDRYGELLAATGFALVAYAQLRSDRSVNEILTSVQNGRQSLIGPVPGDLARSNRASAADALGFAAACYALPAFARQTGVGDLPLLWPWPARLWTPQDREAELITAAGMLVAELERHRPSDTAGRRPVLTVMPGGAR